VPFVTAARSRAADEVDDHDDQQDHDECADSDVHEIFSSPGKTTLIAHDVSRDVH
jgi:hypothetical protein